MADSSVIDVPVSTLAVPDPIEIAENVGLEHFSICNMDPDPDQGGAAPQVPSINLPLVADNNNDDDHDTHSNKSTTPEPGELIPLAQSTLLECQANLKSSEDRCHQLTSQLAERDMMLTTLQRSCGLLEKETTLSKRELTIAQREKESAVMRYAIVEKKVIDANVAKDAAEKRLKEGQREVEALNHKVRQMTTDKTRMTQIIDQKV